PPERTIVATFHAMGYAAMIHQCCHGRRSREPTTANAQTTYSGVTMWEMIITTIIGVPCSVPSGKTIAQYRIPTTAKLAAVKARPYSTQRGASTRRQWHHIWVASTAAKTMLAWKV